MGTGSGHWWLGAAHGGESGVEVVEETTEEHFASARTMVFGGKNPFRSVYMTPGRYAVLRKADDEERGVGLAMFEGLSGLSDRFEGGLK